MASPANMLFTELLENSEDNMKILCNDFGLSNSGPKAVLAYRIKSHLENGEKWCNRQLLEYEQKIAKIEHKLQNSGNSDNQSSFEIEVMRHSTPVFENHAASGNIVARTIEPFVTHRRNHDSQLGQVHYSSSVLPPPLYRDGRSHSASDDSSIQLVGNQHVNHVSAYHAPLNVNESNAIKPMMARFNSDAHTRSYDNLGVSYTMAKHEPVNEMSMHCKQPMLTQSDLFCDLPIVPPPPDFTSIRLAEIKSCPPSVSRQAIPNHAYHTANQSNQSVHSRYDSVIDKNVVLSHPPAHFALNAAAVSTPCYDVASSNRNSTDCVSKTIVKPVYAKTSNPCTMSDGHVQPVIDPSAKSIAYAIHATKTPDLEVFSGDTLTYNDWNKAFTRFIDNNPTYSESDKLFYLRKFTGGEIAPIVEGYYVLDDERAYADIRKVINDRYGNPHKLSQAYLSRLSAWPKVPNNDAVALQRFADFLKTLCTVMITVPSLSYLDHSNENAKIKQILPMWLKRKWNAKAIEFSDNHDGRFPPFSLFADFVVSHSDLVNHSIVLEGEGRLHQGSQKGHTNTIQSTDVVCHSVIQSDESCDSNTSKELVCILCSGNHKLYKCDKFCSMPAKQRHTFVVSNKRCISCLNTHEGKCRMKIFCKGCKRHSDHNSLLHDAVIHDKEESIQSDNKSNVASVCGLSMCHTTNVESTVFACHLTGSTSMIVPVYLSHKSKPEQEILTYAMLDSQSVFTFVTDDLADKVTKPFTSATIGLSTMTSTNVPVHCNVYSDLVVRGFNQSERVSLKFSRGCESIPNDLQVPTQLDLRKWPHLVPVSGKFPPVLDLEVGLLIGHDAHYASFPIDRTSYPPNQGAPYAIKTPVGWTLVGPIDPAKNCDRQRLFSVIRL